MEAKQVADLRRAILNSEAYQGMHAQDLIADLQDRGHLPRDMLFVHLARFWEAVASIPGGAMVFGLGAPSETVVNRTIFAEGGE